MKSIQQIPAPVFLLVIAQGLGMLTAPMVIFVGGFIGVALAPSPAMATLPVASVVVGTALASMPAAFIMQKIGRRQGFVYATLVAILGSILAIFSLRHELFWGVCLSTALLGSHLAFVQQFRFAALEWVGSELAAMTASIIMLGGLFAAWFGPEIALWGKNLLAVTFSGSFVLLAACHVVLLILLSVIPFANLVTERQISKGRSFKNLLSTPAIAAAIASSAIAYAVMSLIMTATPVSMSELQDFQLEQTKTVLQSHIMAMFIPSLFAPIIFKYITTPQLLLMGLVAMVASITIAVWDQSYWGYWSALALLGVGWNFMFVGGTSLLAQNYKSEERFKVQGINELMVFGTQAVASLAAGTIVFNYGWLALNLLALPLLLLALIMIMRWYLKS
ncbi:MFS transporter [Bermanella sp. R86510]|uniref:MFS transporter n=1 Tax=unclassified Bermanella TaxID=2627862 RepID=UPI0037C98B41